MTKSKRTTRKRRGGKKRGKSRRVSGWLRVRRFALRVLLPVGLVLGVAYGAYLDYQVRSAFEGRRWEVPARLYARALELYEGAAISAAQLEWELQRLGYRVVPGARVVGSFAREGTRFRIRTRGFRFWDGQEPSQDLELRISGGQVRSFSASDGSEIVRLDPLEIGGIYPSHREDRILVRLDQVPKLLIDALLAVEDRNFRDHFGLDITAIGRALWANVRAGRTVQGGSTLTQQLVKNFFLSNERSLWRKLNEAAMALLVEWHYDKDAILEAYLNEVYLGQAGRRAIHGFGLASQFYFQQPLEQLPPERLALLVGLVKGPSYYDPRRHPKRARQRRDLVLELMAGQGVIDSAQASQARQRGLGVVARPHSGLTPHPAFVDLVRRQLRRDYQEADLQSEGLRIFTTLDPTVQRHSEEGLSQALTELSSRARTEPLEGAVVVTDTASGEVLAVVGGRRPRYAGFNRALDALRPVGSLIKPAVYLAALEQPQRYTLATLLEDTPIEVPSTDGHAWVPRNFDRQYHGSVPLYRALAESYNVATVRLGLSVGLGRVRETIQALGIRRPLKAYPSLLLGAAALSPVEVAQMYQTLAAGGFRTPLRSIRAVVRPDGQELRRYGLQVSRAADPAAVFLVNAALERVTRDGTGRGLRQYLPNVGPIAGKTGTTDDLRDSWFAGFGDNRLAVVWIGSDRNRPIGLTGSSGALPAWARIARRIGIRGRQAMPPAEVEEVWIDPESGLRSHQDCDGAVHLPFVAGSQPQQAAPSCPGRAGNWLRRILQ